MTEQFTVSIRLPINPEQLYAAWLSSDIHAAFTGAGAQIDPVVGGAFTAWDGYISGVTLEMEPSHRIVQAWRTTEFPEGSPDSRLELLLEAVDEGVMLTLIHSGIPTGQGESYRQGWDDYYFQPLAAYFVA